MSETDEEILHQGGGHMSTAEMKDHLQTWHGFLAFVKWQVIGIAIIMILLAIFRTNG